MNVVMGLAVSGIKNKGIVPIKPLKQKLIEDVNN
jgi:hypothetical protein